MLDYRLYTFLTLSKTLNYTKAANLLCLSQPAVSQHIRYLESTYQTKLFDHEGKTLTLTKQGAYLAKCLQTMAADEQRILSNLTQIQENKHITFGATLTIGEYMLPPKLKTYLEQHPNTNITMLVENTATLLDMLNQGEIQFAIVEGYFPSQDYEHQTIRTQPFVAVKGKDYPLSQEVHTIKDLLHHRLIVREHGSGTREILERILKETNLSIEMFPHSIEIGNIVAIKHLVQENMGITFLYQAAVEEELKKGTISMIPLQDFHIQREFTFITLKDSIFLDEYKAFLSELF